MRRFVLRRSKDGSGVSGTGVVAQGVESDSGRVVMFWLTAPRSIVMFDSAHDVINIHGHKGRTTLKWLDPPNGSKSKRARTKGET